MFVGLCWFMLVSFEGYSVLFRAFHTSYTKAVDQRKCMQRPCCVEKSFDWEWNWMELGKSDPKLDSTCRHCRVWSHWQFHSPRSRCMHQSSRSLLSYSALIFIASSPCHHVISYRPWEPRGCFLNLPSKTPLSRLEISGKLCQHHRCPHHGPQQGCTTACDAQGPRTFTGGLLHPFKPKRWNIRIWWFVLWPNHWGYRMHSWFCPWKNRLYLRDCVFLCRHCVCVHPSHTSTIFAPCFFAITCMAALYSAQAFLWTLLKKKSSKVRQRGWLIVTLDFTLQWGLKIRLDMDNMWQQEQEMMSLMYTDVIYLISFHHFSPLFPFSPNSRWLTTRTPAPRSRRLLGWPVS